MDIVTLHTGAQVPATALSHTRVQLAILERSPVFLDELLAWVRDREEPSPEAFARLQQLRILDETGNIHDVTRDIVLASYIGSGGYLTRVNPVHG